MPGRFIIRNPHDGASPSIKADDVERILADVDAQ